MPTSLLSSPLTTPASTPKQPIEIRGDSEEMDDYSSDVQFIQEKRGDNKNPEAQLGLQEENIWEVEVEEYEVQAIIARRGGWAGKPLMYKIRWVIDYSMLSDAFLCSC